MNEETLLNEESKKDSRKLSLKNQLKTKKGRTRFITRVSMFTALSFIFYAWLKFPLPFLPPFLEISFSYIFIILGSLLTGPIGAITICVLRIILKIIFVGTTSSYVGEITDLILSLCIALPPALSYLFKHDKMGGFIGIVLSFISWIIFSTLINYFVSINLYVRVYFDGDKTSLINLLSKTIKNINDDNYKLYYCLFGVIPFNMICGFINCGLAFIVYKRISTLLKRIGI